jgi:hypothetical protein
MAALQPNTATHVICPRPQELEFAIEAKGTTEIDCRREERRETRKEES